MLTKKETRGRKRGTTKAVIAARRAKTKQPIIPKVSLSQARSRQNVDQTSQSKSGSESPINAGKEILTGFGVQSGQDSSINNIPCPKCNILFEVAGIQKMHNETCTGKPENVESEPLKDDGIGPEEFESIKSRFESARDLSPESMAFALEVLFDFMSERIGPEWRASPKECKMLVAGCKPVIDHYFKSSNNQMWLGCVLAIGVFSVPRILIYAKRKSANGEGRKAVSFDSGKVGKRQDNIDENADLSFSEGNGL